MTLELAAIPLAFLSGILCVLSPCVWPLVPVVTSSAATGGHGGVYYLAGGLSLSFAVAGTLVTWLLVSTGLDPELFRYLAAGMMVLVALVLLVKSFGDRLAFALSSLTGRFSVPAGAEVLSASGQFGIGALLGFVWLPCVGPTLGAAIALASLGQSFGMAFVVMLAYGVGTAGVLLGAGILSGKALARWRNGALSGGRLGKKVLGGALLVLGLLVFTGVDKVLEALAVDLLPAWVFML